MPSGDRTSRSSSPSPRTETRPAASKRPSGSTRSSVPSCTAGTPPPPSAGGTREDGSHPIGNVEALELLAEACAHARDELHVEVHPGLDLAASEFYDHGQYRYKDRTLDPAGQVAFVSELVDRYGLRYLEDPIEQESFEGFADVTRAVGDRTLVIGDDIFVTKAERLATGIAHRSTNAVLIKVNQVGHSHRHPGAPWTSPASTGWRPSPPTARGRSPRGGSPTWR